MAHLQQIQYEQQLAPLLSGVDIILAAGSNTRLGDDNDVPAVFNGHSANFAGPYPIVTSGADGGTTLIVNTDNEYTYLGRLVVDFNDQGEIALDSLDTLINGAYAANAATVATAWNVAEADLATTAFAAGTKGANVALLTGAVQDVIETKDGQIWGHTTVYLEGERAFVRNQETNLGNLSADANLAYARSVDPSVVVSLKNGGGIRAQIGSADVISGEKLPPAANPAAGKPQGSVSTLDIENALRFNNGLSLVTLTAAQFRQVVEHSLVGAGTSQGRFPQIGGFALSYDLSQPEGSRVVSMAIENEAGISTDVIVRDGALVGDPSRTFRMVTLNFLAGGGDSYPFPSFSGLDRVDLQATTSSGAATFAVDGSEQDALAEFLLATTTAATPYDRAETAPDQDGRLQNLAQRIDSVIDPVITAVGLADGVVTAASKDRRVFGMASPGSQVDVLVDDTLMGTTTASASGEFIYPFTPANLQAIGQGSQEVVARLSAAPDGQGASSPFSFEVSTLTASLKIDTLVGTPLADDFVFPNFHTGVPSRTRQYDTIVDYQVGDRIDIRRFSERVMGAPTSRRITKVEGEAKNLSNAAINKVLGTGFGWYRVGAFTVEGMNGTFVAVNNGRGRFDNSDMLIHLQDFNLSTGSPITLA
jgi:2',3'-cyclic-nucleotide 2'-phosphodiesterase (5'-nucleotidase family)